MADVIDLTGWRKVGSTTVAPVKLGSDQASSEVIRRGQAVLARLECNLTWDPDWRDLILALGAGRDMALRAAGTDKPQGPKYRKAIGPWLRCYGFDRIDEADRSRLLQCFDNLATINAWRLALPAETQAKLNHPRTVLAHWQRSLRPESKLPPNNLARSAPATTIAIADVLRWLRQASPADKRQVAAALAKDTAAMKAILPAKALPPKATPKQVYARAMALLSADGVPPVTH